MARTRDIPEEVSEVSVYDLATFCNPESAQGKKCERDAKAKGRYAVMHREMYGESLVTLARFKSRKKAFGYLKEQGFWRSRRGDWWNRSAFW